MLHSARAASKAAALAWLGLGGGALGCTSTPASAVPPMTQLVIGVRGHDARQGDERNRIDALVAQLAPLHAREVRRLPFAVVVEVGDEAGARALLRSRAEVRWVEEETHLLVRLRYVPNDPLYPAEWHLHAAAGIDAEPAWDVTRGLKTDGTAVRVAVVDDGFDLAHPDLSERYTSERINLSQGLPGDARAGFGHGDKHGTETAGVIAASGDNGIGVTGVCPACAIVPVRLLGEGGPTGLYELDSTVAAAAMIWAVDEGHADVINNSWGPPDGSLFDPLAPRELQRIPAALAEALTYAATRGRGGLGTVITWAAGNGAELCTYDRFASHPAVMAVGAVDQSGRLAYYSDFGPTLWLTAPSGGKDLSSITTCDLSGAAGGDASDYTGAYTGTSAAAAAVAGAAALLIARYPKLTAAQVREALALGATRVDAEHGRYDDTGRSPKYGFGLVNLPGALAVAATYTDPCTHALELCGNGIDDNCDGVIDEASQCKECVPNAGLESCDGVDNNCDGEVDEDFVCVESDRPVCAPCLQTSQCQSTASCRRDADLGGPHCFLRCDPAGACAEGYACVDGSCTFSPSAALPDCRAALVCHEPETCDGRDNDCNGVIDDLAPNDPAARVYAHDACGFMGVCQNVLAYCDLGTWRCAYPGAWQPVETRCDGLDNDCDGVVDEGCSPAGATSCAGATPGLLWLAVALLAWLYRRSPRRIRSGFRH